MIRISPLFLCLILTGWLCGCQQNASEHTDKSLPNIIVILADDMGYGDIQQYNPASRIPTPNLNRLYKEATVFTDAHSPSAVCTPTRYGLLTGRYAWRTRLKSGVLSGYSPHLIEPDRQTLPKVLKKAGYHTGVVGKWHLGLDWSWSGGTFPEGGNNLMYIPQPDNLVDFAQPVAVGPKENGFDYSYVIPGSLDMGPYVYLENNRSTAIPDSAFPGSGFPAYIRPGEQDRTLAFDQVLRHLTDQATSYIHQQAKSTQPFFLYFPLTGPHKPALPNPAFAGKSGLGPYADLVMEVDHTVGRIIQALEDAGVEDNTLLLYTSDNGSYMHRFEEQENDHVSDSTQQGYYPTNHKANADWRGTKADIWEAGHRVPFIVRYPGHVKAGVAIDQTICHTDILATLSEMTGQDFGKNESPDSYSFLPLLNGQSTERPPVIHHSVRGMFSLRKGDFKLVMGNGSGGREKPAGKAFEKPYQLFNLSDDPGESKDLAGMPEFASLMDSLSAGFKGISGASVQIP